VFVLLSRGPLRVAVGLAAAGVCIRIAVMAGTIGTVWMLSGFGWLAVMAFYALTVMWPVFLWFELRSGPALAGWMLPLAILEGAGPMSQLAGTVTTALLGAPRFELQSASAAVLAIAQVFFLLRKMRTA
jgi:hypothetical protein